MGSAELLCLRQDRAQSLVCAHPDSSLTFLSLDSSATWSSSSPPHQRARASHACASPDGTAVLLGLCLSHPLELLILHVHHDGSSTQLAHLPLLEDSDDTTSCCSVRICSNPSGPSCIALLHNPHSGICDALCCTPDHQGQLNSFTLRLNRRILDSDSSSAFAPIFSPSILSFGCLPSNAFPFRTQRAYALVALSSPSLPQSATSFLFQLDDFHQTLRSIEPSWLPTKAISTASAACISRADNACHALPAHSGSDSIPFCTVHVASSDEGKIYRFSNGQPAAHATLGDVPSTQLVVAQSADALIARSISTSSAPTVHILSRNALDHIRTISCCPAVAELPKQHLDSEPCLIFTALLDKQNESLYDAITLTHLLMGDSKEYSILKLPASLIRASLGQKSKDSSHQRLAERRKHEVAMAAKTSADNARESLFRSRWMVRKKRELIKSSRRSLEQACGFDEHTAGIDVVVHSCCFSLLQPEQMLLSISARLPSVNHDALDARLLPLEWTQHERSFNARCSACDNTSGEVLITASCPSWCTKLGLEIDLRGADGEVNMHRRRFTVPSPPAQRCQPSSEAHAHLQLEGEERWLVKVHCSQDEASEAGGNVNTVSRQADHIATTHNGCVLERNTHSAVVALPTRRQLRGKSLCDYPSERMLISSQDFRAILLLADSLHAECSKRSSLHKTDLDSDSAISAQCELDRRMSALSVVS